MLALLKSRVFMLTHIELETPSSNPGPGENFLLNLPDGYSES